jgi:hypothetical protein
MSKWKTEVYHDETTLKECFRSAMIENVLYWITIILIAYLLFSTTKYSIPEKQKLYTLARKLNMLMAIGFWGGIGALCIANVAMKITLACLCFAVFFYALFAAIRKYFILARDEKNKIKNMDQTQDDEEFEEDEDDFIYDKADVFLKEYRKIALIYLQQKDERIWNSFLLENGKAVSAQNQYLLAHRAISIVNFMSERDVVYAKRGGSVFYPSSEKLEIIFQFECQTVSFYKELMSKLTEGDCA